MDEFIKRLESINRAELKEFLCSLKFPCFESRLLKKAFPDMDISNAGPLDLYQNHFVLFHLLYLLQDEFEKEGKYLFVHFMRTFLSSYPKDGHCRYYDENANCFCNASCRSDQGYCDFHSKQKDDMALEELSIKYFYLDKNNFYTFDEETAGLFLDGAFELLRNYDAYKDSFKVLGISETSDAAFIKKQFRALAKKYHPDHGAQSHEKFNEINRAYRLLMKIIKFTG